MPGAAAAPDGVFARAVHNLALAHRAFRAHVIKQVIKQDHARHANMGVPDGGGGSLKRVP